MAAISDRCRSPQSPASQSRCGRPRRTDHVASTPLRYRITHGSITHAARFAFHVCHLEVNTMDLTTLITACTLTVDPKIIHALTWHQSGGEPWAFSVPGQHHPQVLKSMEDAVR